MRRHVLGLMPVALCAAIAATMAPGGGSQVQAAVTPVLLLKRTPDTLSVMSYNVEGLPPPIRFGRADSIGRIGEGLARMRGNGEQPHVVLLQEAFRDSADRVARLGGYRYVVRGPSADAVNETKPGDERAKSFARHATLLKGEGAGKWLGSGLAILSDYPIRRVARMAFPQWACAGYDCLANKGAVIAWIEVPGSAEPVAFVDTHLNSRSASGVAPARANEAYDYQLTSLRAFLHSRIPEDAPAFLGGDFNVGSSPTRIGLARPGFLADASDVDAVASGNPSMVPDAARADFVALVKRDKDFLFYRGSADWPLRMTRLTIPFGHAPDGSSLSDHLGYEVSFETST